MRASLLAVAFAWALLAALTGTATAQPSPASAQRSPVSAQRSPAAAPKIDLYTMGVGDMVVEKFGHAALCTRYPTEPRRDRCYNYGTTNFADPAGLGWNFVRGRAKFWVSVVNPDQMIDLYIRRDRTVWVQELPLSPEEARQIADKLRFDDREENRYYIYHHYFDNCTTRIRDILDATLGGVLKTDSDGSFGASYRELSREGFAESTALLIASDYVLGRIGDKVPSLWEAMFLPRVLREVVHKRLGAAPVVVYERQAPMPSTTPGPVRLYMILFGLLLALPAWVGWARGSIAKAALAPSAIYLSLLGLILWLLAVLSPLDMARYNEGLALFVPFDLLLLFASPVIRKRYSQARSAIIAIALLAAIVGIFKQPLWAIGIVPLAALLPHAIPNRKTPSAGQ